MYINDTHILIYVIFGIIGFISGQFIDWCNKRMPEYKKVFSKDFFIEYKKILKPNYILMSITAIMFVGLVYFFGVSIDLFKYALLVPMLLIAFCIDLKLQIIPNRLTLSLFETGLAFTFIEVISNTGLGLNVLTNNLLGMIIGGGIFLLITVIGGFIAGKEAMGFGDVKLMAALGLLFGLSNIIVITLLSFLIGAILSVLLLITKIKKSSEYIPFGPFIVIGTFISMYVPFETIKNILMNIFTLGLYKG